jgi:hypothetical protein
MSTLRLALSLLACHFVFDFMLQSHKMACNKSKSNFYLTLHVAVYSLWTLGLFGFPNWFWPWIFGTHWCTDFVTSRITSRLWRNQAYHDFFVVIGLDQLLHYVAIMLGVYWAGWL